jgi:protein FAM32A
MKKNTHFVGGPLKLKNLKPDKTLKKMKKIITNDIKVMQKEKAQKESEATEETEKIYNTENKLKYDFDTRTEAEKRFDDVKLKRLPEKVEKNIIRTFKDKVNTFTKTLSKQPEHYDIPKVGPG